MTGHVPRDPVAELPSGLLTVLFTDLEESTALWEQDPAEMRRVMNVHDEILDRVVQANDGIVFKSTGDGIGAVFTSPSAAVDAAVAIQRSLQLVPWRSERPRVRIGLHLGDVAPTRGEYYGAAVNRAARIMDAVNGDQIAVSDDVAAYLDADRTVAIGAHHLRGIGVEMLHLVRHEDLIADDRPPRASSVPARRRLPAATTRSVGRSEDVSSVCELLESNRLVTIVGAGGVGKTHVALSVGRASEDLHHDGVVLVELASILEADDVGPAIAAALGARVQPGLDLDESIVDYLDDRELLIVLDNCEHVLNEVQVLVERLLTSDGVTVLATSRTAFGSNLEQVFPLVPLTSAHGVELFVDRARRRDPGFDSAAEQLDAIAAIVSAVDGVPLGIELAAAWVRVLPVAEIARHLAGSLDVPGRQLDRAERHHSLHATIEWSYRRLDEDERRLFEQLSVFSGGFSIESVEAVCAEEGLERPGVIAGLVMALVDASMVDVERTESGPRFSMLRPLRLFASGALVVRGDAEVVHARHGEHFREAVDAFSRRLISGDEVQMWQFIEVEWTNVRQAFAYFRSEGRIETAATLLCDLGWFSTMSLRPEPFSWADDLLPYSAVLPTSTTAALHGLRAIHKYFAVDADSRTDAEFGLALDPSDPYGFCRIALGAVWVKNQHQIHESEGWTHAWVESLTEASPLLSRMWALGMRAFHLAVHDPYAAEAGDCLEAIRLIASETASPSARALSQWAEGMSILSTGRSLDDALAAWADGRSAAASLSDMHLVAHLIVGLELHFTAEGGELEPALEMCRRALRDAREQHYIAGTSHLFGVTGILLSRVGRLDVGRSLVPTMLAHGHVPRQNAIDALALDASEFDAVLDHIGASESVLAIQDAALLADDELSAALIRLSEGDVHSEP